MKKIIKNLIILSLSVFFLAVFFLVSAQQVDAANCELSGPNWTQDCAMDTQGNRDTCSNYAQCTAEPRYATCSVAGSGYDDCSLPSDICLRFSSIACSYGCDINQGGCLPEPAPACGVVECRARVSGYSSGNPQYANCSSCSGYDICGTFGPTDPAGSCGGGTCYCAASIAENCTNSVDDDGDGDTDCADSECSNSCNVCITTCTNNDACCPSGCNSGNDNNCSASCTPSAACAASTCTGSTCTGPCGNVYAGTMSCCTPSAACAASTCTGSTCTGPCGNVYAGTLSPDDSCAANTCVGQTCTDPLCGATISGTKTPDCSAASTICAGVTFSDGCSGTCNGTKDCSGIPPPPLSITTRSLRIWDGSKVVKLLVKPVADVLASGKGVIKIAMSAGDTNSALDLVETGEVDASGIRIRTSYGIKSCRKAMDFCQVNITGNTEVLTDVVPTYDGGYAAIGQISTGGNDIIIAKYKANGIIDWAKTIGGGSAETARALMQTADGSLILLGSTTSYGQGSNDLFLAKFSSTGTFIWAKAFGTANSETANSISPTSDGGYVISGQTNSPLGVLLVKFFGDDSLAWARNIRENGPYTSVYPGGYPNSVTQASDGNYLIAGTLYSDIYGRAALIKVAEDGSSVLFSSAVSRWFTGTIYVLSGNSVVEAADNNSYILSGYVRRTNSSSANGTGMVAKLNTSDGSFVWGKSISAGIAEARLTSMINTADGGYAFSGAGGYHAIRILSSITKLDSDANITWQKILPKVLTIPYMANSLAQTMDGGFVAVGTKSNDALIMKTDDEGLACFGNNSGSMAIGTNSTYSGFSFVVAMSNVTLTQQTVASPTINNLNLTETSCCNE